MLRKKRNVFDRKPPTDEDDTPGLTDEPGADADILVGEAVQHAPVVVHVLRHLPRHPVDLPRAVGPRTIYALPRQVKSINEGLKRDE